ncbi:hypothetical protein HAX54_042037 [Datura stramonium]|uniref:Uncharacterized protein n=1 Tax=Datura stramonium TaxID=4076 RepID=A0ABS8W3K9_DATST|nr:hypothetical protein [Datura stramonium]
MSLFDEAMDVLPTSRGPINDLFEGLGADDEENLGDKGNDEENEDILRKMRGTNEDVEEFHFLVQFQSKESEIRTLRYLDGLDRSSPIAQMVKLPRFEVEQLWSISGNSEE